MMSNMKKNPTITNKKVIQKQKSKGTMKKPRVANDTHSGVGLRDGGGGTWSCFLLSALSNYLPLCYIHVLLRCNNN